MSQGSLGDLPAAFTASRLPGLPPPRRGKVRDVYDLGETLLLVATDRISAYDHVLEPGIPGKGAILTQLSTFAFELLAPIVRHHLLAIDIRDFPPGLRRHEKTLRGRAVVVRKARVIPFECVARGYLAGSGYRDYRASGAVCGLPLPPGLRPGAKLPEPIFTPATKAERGHDENISFETMAEVLGTPLAIRLRELTLKLYRAGAAHAALGGLILADTKLELGVPIGEPATMSDATHWSDVEPEALLLVDEALTPDSSRYWDLDGWRPGSEPASFDKQFVRNWLDSSGWDHESPPPPLPAEVVWGTFERYREAFRRLTGREPELT